MTDSKVVVLARQEKLRLGGFETAQPSICIVGRARDCNLTIPAKQDRKVSRHHCLFDINPPGILLKDLGSRNGTFLNGEDLREQDTPIRVVPGDTVVVGDTQLEIKLTGIEATHIKRDPFCKRCGKVIRAASINADTDGDFMCWVCRQKSLDMYDCDGDLDPKRVRKKIIGRYRIIRRLGTGGLGAVFLGQIRGGLTQAAIKFLLPDTAVSRTNRDRFLREAENMRVLEHENIVCMRESGYSDGIFYIVLDYCNAGTLAEHLEKNGPLELGEAMRLTCQILDGLDHAHHAKLQSEFSETQTLEGIVHRDIKPENILLNNNDGELTAKLGDFGLAKAFNSAGFCGFTQTGMVGGTLAFMCRQQLLNYKYAKPEVDIWSAAAVLYYMLACQRPRQVKNKNAITAVLEQDCDSLAKHCPELPRSLIEVIDRALDDNDELWYQSAAELKKDLQDALS